MESREAPTKEQWAFLGLVRFCLAVCVVMFHCGSDGSFRPWNSLFGGTGAVVGFLFISGFSIAWSLSKSDEGFYQRRFLRIYPLYAVCLLIPFALGQLKGENMLGFAGYFLFLQGMVVEQIRNVIGVTWSLSAEWWLYMIAPKVRTSFGPWIAALGMMASAAFCAKFGWKAVLYGNLTVPVLGCTGFWFAGFSLAQKKSWQMVCLGIVCCFVTFYFGWFGKHDFLKVSSTVTACAGLLSVALLPSLPTKLVKVGNWLGDISYPTYLIHMVFIEASLKWPAVLPSALASAAALNQLDHMARKPLTMALGRLFPARA